MANELNRYSSNANIKCPYFVKQEEKKGSVIKCHPMFEGQITTHLLFQSKKAKFDHFENFCFTYSWKQCPIACAIEEALRLDGW